MNLHRNRVMAGLMVLGMVATLASGCASAAPGGRTASPPRVRCLDEISRPGAADSPRPLFFLFCMQSP
jgi:hypothetical protein